MPLNNTIQSLKTYFKTRDGIQRPNRFSIQFNLFSTGLQGVSQFQESEYLADEILINETAIDHVSDNLAGYGIGRLVPRRLRYANGVTIIFPVAGDNKIIKFIDSWFKSLYGTEIASGQSGNFYTNYYDQAVKNCNLRVRMLDLNGKPSSTFWFKEVFPTQSLPIRLAATNADPYLRYGVTFNFREYVYDLN
jgi:hypothetical protein